MCSSAHMAAAAVDFARDRLFWLLNSAQRLDLWLAMVAMGP